MAEKLLILFAILCTYIFVKDQLDLRKENKLFKSKLNKAFKYNKERRFRKSSLNLLKNK